jgi:tetratricopeptide (TPR) repeat protein
MSELQESLARARQLHGQARLEDAASSYMQALRMQPGNAEALTGLGLLRAAQGNRPEAEAMLSRACALSPEAAELQTQLGGLLLAWHRPHEALERFNAALQLAPNAAEPHYNQAQALVALGRLNEAVTAYRATLALAPDLARAHARLAQCLQALGDGAAALPHFERAVALGGAAPALRNDFGAALAGLSRHEEAIAQFASVQAPPAEFAAAQNNLGNSLMALERYRPAVEAYRAAIRTAPDFALAHGNLGNALLELGHPEDALAPFERALSLAPQTAEFHNGRARTLVLLGREAAARGGFAQAVALAPGQPGFYEGLASTHDLAADDPRFLALQDMAARADEFSQQERMALHFTLHRVYEKQGSFATAFMHLREGNRLRRQLIAYDEAQALALMARIAELFDATSLHGAPAAAGPPDLPIFILGMPRSGSTLVEQILASHRDVHGGGEQLYLLDEATRLGRAGSASLPYPENIPGHTAAELEAAAASYRARLRRLAPAARHITDKMPANFLHIGLIRMMLPQARIIHTRRSALDTCLSCFAQTFTKGQPFANDLGELGRYYRAYERLMAHWRATLPEGAMLEVEYEALVEDFEPQVRRILDYCGLAWDPACLAFHEHERVVLTASAAQVRRPLYRHAAGRAASYGAALNELRAALRD